MNKRTVRIENISSRKQYKELFDAEIKKIKAIPKMPKCEFKHIGATSMINVLGENIVDILVIVENLHEITTFDEKRLNNINYHRIAHNSIKGVIKYARLIDYFSMNYDVVLYVVQRNTDIYNDFLKSIELLSYDNIKVEYNDFKKRCLELSFKEYSNEKAKFIGEILKKVRVDDRSR